MIDVLLSLRSSWPLRPADDRPGPGRHRPGRAGDAAPWSKTLLTVAAATALTAAVLTVLALVDHRQVTGVDRWLKPWKFSVSITVYVLTLAWMTRLVRHHRRAATAMAGTGAVGMLLELVAITGQAARGRMSHFNDQTPLDSTVFSLMGSVVMLVWAATAVLALVLVREHVSGAGLRTGLHWGLAVTLIGMLSAVLMVNPLNALVLAHAGGPPAAANGAHTVGALDGGPGLPLLGWSTIAGDLRVGHFVGLHALQLLPLLGWLLDRSPGWTAHQRRRLVRTAGAGYLGVVLLLLWQALRAEPLTHPGTLTLASATGLAAAVAAAVATVVLRDPRRRSASRTADDPDQPAQGDRAAGTPCALPVDAAPHSAATASPTASRART